MYTTPGDIEFNLIQQLESQQHPESLNIEEHFMYRTDDEVQSMRQSHLSPSMKMSLNGQSLVFGSAVTVIIKSI